MKDFKTIKYEPRNAVVKEMIKKECERLGISKQEFINRAMEAKARVWAKKGGEYK